MSLQIVVRDQSGAEYFAHEDGVKQRRALGKLGQMKGDESGNHFRLAGTKLPQHGKRRLYCVRRQRATGSH